MRYFIDTEFWEQRGSIQLISLAMVCEDGRELYIENRDFIWGDCTLGWLHENVRPHLRGGDALMSYDDIGASILAFVGADEKPEFWAYYADYDWVALCWTFGSMANLPKHFPQFCLDIKQWAFMRGNIRLPDQHSQRHDALTDARWTQEAWQFLYDLK